MSRVSSFVLSLALAAATPLAFSATPAAAQTVSQAVGKPLQEAVALAKKGNAAAAGAKIQAARAAVKSDFEKKKVAEAAAYVYTVGRNYGAAAKELESIGAGPNQVAPLYYQAGNYQAAIKAASKSGSPDMQLIVAQSYVKMNQPAKAADAYKKLLAKGTRKEWLEGLAAAQYKMGQKDEYLKTLERLIKADPSPANWSSLLYNLKNEPMGGQAKLALFQLMMETGNLKSGPDYDEFAQLATINGAPGLGKKVLEQGIAAKALPNDARVQSLMTRMSGMAQTNATSVTKLASSANPTDLMKAGMVYTSLANHQAAATAFAKAGTKPEALINLGIAQVRAGNTPAAKTTFGKIPAGSAYKDIAGLWSLYATTKR